MDKLTGIETTDNYISSIGGNKENILGIWETGSFLEGISDEFSDRDFIIIWDNSIPNANLRLKSANDLGFDIHEIKDIANIGQSFDLFSDGKFLFNIGYATKEKKRKWQDAITGEKVPSDIEEILMSISALNSAKIYFQKNNWVDNLKKEVQPTTEMKQRIINHYKSKTGVDLKLLEKSTKRKDIIQFIHYLEKVLRALQIVYLLENNKPIISSKKFEERFAKIENGEITKLIRKITSDINMAGMFEDLVQVAKGLGIEKSEKMKA